MEHDLLLFIDILCALLLLPASVTALSAGEVVALKDMQAEWGVQLGWTGTPSCSWRGITCDALENVIIMCVLTLAFFLL